MLVWQGFNLDPDVGRDAGLTTCPLPGVSMVGKTSVAKQSISANVSITDFGVQMPLVVVFG